MSVKVFPKRIFDGFCNHKKKKKFCGDIDIQRKEGGVVLIFYKRGKNALVVSEQLPITGPKTKTMSSSLKLLISILRNPPQDVLYVDEGINLSTFLQ